MKKYSLYALFICYAVQFYFGHLFYPKYEQQFTEATISWDVSGYYFYLPSIFIYQDLKQLKFSDNILKQYRPTPYLQQAYLHDNGNYVMKYSLGQSIQYLPWFGLGHAWATASPQYEADGFSYPYQIMLSIGMLLLAFLGLWILRLVLLYFFSDLVTALTLISIVLGSNYLDYSAINGAMTHNSLFTLYALLLLATIKFHQKPGLLRALFIGGIIGWAALIRPTEIIAAIIPLLWGLKGLNKKNILEHTSFLKSNIRYLIPAILLAGGIGFLQLLYWKYTGGDWIIYSYQDQGFDWFKPHFKKGILGFNTGWLVYSPIMIFSLVGFYFLMREKIAESNKDNIGKYGLFGFSLIFIYLCFAWNDWHYGGSLGVRAMIQSYPILAFPMAFSFNYFLKSKIWSWILGGLIILFCVYNIWLTKNVHNDGVIHAGQMTKAYLFKVLGKNKFEKSDLKLLDTDEEFTGERSNVKNIYFDDFENTGENKCKNLSAIEGQASICVSQQIQQSPKFAMPIENSVTWVRAKGTFKISEKESSVWNMTQFTLKALDENGKKLKQRFIRIQRQLNKEETNEVFIDFSLPKGTKSLEVFLDNAGSGKPLMMDNLNVESFN